MKIKVLFPLPHLSNGENRELILHRQEFLHVTEWVKTGPETIMSRKFQNIILKAFYGENIKLQISIERLMLDFKKVNCLGGG